MEFPRPKIGDGFLRYSAIQATVTNRMRAIDDEETVFGWAAMLSMKL